jgi:hypothetical protein
MGIKAAIRSVLLADADLVVQIGNRISPRIAKTGDIMPRISYVVNGKDPSYHLDGVGSWQLDNFNLAIHANSSDQCDEISSMVKEIFHAVRDVIGQGVTIRRFMLQASSEAHQDDSTEKPVYELIQSWEVSYYG